MSRIAARLLRAPHHLDCESGNGGAKSDKVLDTLLAAERIQPDDVRVQLALGRQYLLKSDSDAALRHLRLALQTHDYSTDDDQAALVDFYLARVLQQKGYDRAALDSYGRLVRRLEHGGSDLRGSAELAYLINRPEGLYGDIGRLYEKHGFGSHTVTLRATL
jgi:tetratricopeptide (TPR) repeat protein